MAMKTKDRVPQIVQDYIHAKDNGYLDENTEQVLTPFFENCFLDDYFHSKQKVFGKTIHKIIQTQTLANETQQALLGPFKLPKFDGGDVLLGFDQTGKEIWIPRTYLTNGHSITVSRTGGGKTLKAIHIISQTGKTIIFWIFDTEKGGEFRSLKRLLKRHGIKVFIIKARELRLNPLQCEESVNPIDFAPRVSDLIIKVFELPPSASKSTHKIVLKLYKQFGVLDGSKNYPTLFDLYLAIVNDKEIHKQSKMALLNSLDPVLLSIGSVLKYRVGWTTKDLAKRRIIFELDGIGEADKNLILNTLILKEFISRLAQRNS